LRAIVFLYGGKGVRVHVSGKRKRKKCVVIAGDGDPCPRCGNPMQIREYADLKEKQEGRVCFTRAGSVA
jgi:hypothetical protein